GTVGSNPTLSAIDAKMMTWLRKCLVVQGGQQRRRGYAIPAVRAEQAGSGSHLSDEDPSSAGRNCEPQNGETLRAGDKAGDGDQPPTGGPEGAERVPWRDHEAGGGRPWGR